MNRKIRQRKHRGIVFDGEMHYGNLTILEHDYEAARAKAKELEAENAMLKAMKLLTVKDVAEMLQISTRTVYDHTHRPKFTPRSHTQKVRKISAS